MTQEYISTTAGELTFGEMLKFDGLFWQFVGLVIVKDETMARIARGAYLREEKDIGIETPVERVVYKNE